MIAPPSRLRAVALTGVDGTNPLGFLCALGTLVAAREAGEATARLRWVRARTWTPVLDGLTASDETELCERLARALTPEDVSDGAEARCEAARKAYDQVRTKIKKARDEIKKQKLGKQERNEEFARLVRPLENEAEVKRRAWLDALKAAAPRPELALGARIDCTAGEYRDHATAFTDRGDAASRAALRYLAAFGSDACVENEKDRGPIQERTIEATPFCFIRGSGNQYFLDTVRKLLSEVTATRLSKALFEPWTYRDEKLSMRWDPNEDKRYALTDTKPADEGAKTVWMANLLAYRALALFPCAPTRRGLATTAWADVEGEWVFTWPIWEFAAEPDTVQTILQLGELQEARLRPDALKARGIVAVFRARRIRFPPRGASYKLNFSPARGLL